MDIPDSKKTFRRVGIAVLVVIALVAVAGISWRILGKKQNIFSKQVNYVISGVPYIGIYNHKGALTQLIHDKDSMAASVLEYWNPGRNDFQKIERALNNREITLNEIVSFINGDSGMKAEAKVLSLDELRNYISSQVATPLIAFFAVSEDQPAEAQYYPARVLIGLKESEKKLVFHDYWFGNNYEVSFDEYGKLVEKTPPVLRNKYLIIQPVDLKGKLKEIKKRQTSPYPPRTEIMNKAEGMFKNYAMAVNPYYSKQFDLAEKYFFAVISDPGFEEFFPPQYKVRAYTELAKMQLGKNDLENALKNVQIAVELNHDLDKPFKDWPGYELSANAPGHWGEFIVSYRVQGNIYMALKDFQKAKESYEKALVIKPINPKAKAGLAAAEEAINKK